MKRLSLLLSITLCVGAQAQIVLTPVGGYDLGGETAAEISAYDPGTRRVFSTNGESSRIDVYNIANPASPVSVGQIPLADPPTSVAADRGIIAVAVPNATKTDPGKVKFYSAQTLQFLGEVTVGALPDMLTFTPNGNFVLVANEGEPNSYNQADSVDPEGSVSIIDVRVGVINISQDKVRTAQFTASTPLKNAASIRIFGPNATFAQDVEPEYITVSHNSKTAWVSLQENNAIAVIDIDSATVTEVIGLGFKNHNLPGNGFDPSDRDSATNGGINIRNWPVFGMYQPDAIGAYFSKGETYIVTANEGDARDYTGFAEEIRVGAGGYPLDPTVFPNQAVLKNNANLGRLTVTSANGNFDGDGDFDAIFAFGARSFSIRSAGGDLIFDSGDQLEQITAAQFPALFNSQGTPADFDTRSDNKGPEPEGLAIGKVFGRTYAFICLERIGGLMVYDVTEPAAPSFVQYITTVPTDLAPEGVVFVSEDESSTGNPLLIVSHEGSGTIRIFEITKSKKK